jgi:hypothetical protein
VGTVEGEHASQNFRSKASSNETDHGAPLKTKLSKGKGASRMSEQDDEQSGDENALRRAQEYAGVAMQAPVKAVA